MKWCGMNIVVYKNWSINGGTHREVEGSECLSPSILCLDGRQW